MSLVAIEGLDRDRLGDGPRVVTDGSFDGVHIGHQSLLRETVRFAGERSAVPTVLTYEPLPAEFFGRPAPRRRLTPLPEKLSLLERCGIGACVILPFDQALADMPAERFVREILGEGLNAVGVAVAEGHTIGSGAEVGAIALADLAERRGISVRVIPPKRHGGGRVSSTRVRAHLRSGAVRLAQELLDRPYQAAGRVVAGEQRGRRLGFPTANLDVPEEKLLPADGVYACHAAVGDAVPEPRAPSSAVVNIGRSPTFGEQHRRVEAHLLDFSGELVGEMVHLFFAERLRRERPFSTPGELVTQIERDVERARLLLGTLPSP
jgi:riboflavin kinase/FMN adenylyltransferase